MRSFRKASLGDKTFTTEQGSDSMQRSASAHRPTKAVENESVFSGITGLVRRSFPRPVGRSSRNLSRDIGESTTLSTSVRSSMYLDGIVDDVAKEAEYSPSASRSADNGNLDTPSGSHPIVTTTNLANRSFPKVFARCSTRHLNNNSSSCRSLVSSTSSQLEENLMYVKVDMASELSMLEDLLKSQSKSPSKLLSRDFPMTSTHGSSLGSSMGSDLSSKNAFDDQSSSNCDNLNADESLSKADLTILLKGVEHATDDTQIARKKVDSPPGSRNCSNDNNTSTEAVEKNDVQSSDEKQEVGSTLDFTSESKIVHSAIPRRRIQFVTKLLRRCPNDGKK